MNKTFISALFLALSFVPYIAGDAACPSKSDQLLKSFEEAYNDFKETTCQKCDGKVGETKEQLAWIESILFNKILSKDIIGVPVPDSVKKFKPLIGDCAKKAVPTEKDFCHDKQQNAFVGCLKMRLLEILANQAAVKWAKENCDAMQEYMITNHKTIVKELKKIGKMYIDAECGSKSG